MPDRSAHAEAAQNPVRWKERKSSFFGKEDLTKAGKLHRLKGNQKQEKAKKERVALETAAERACHRLKTGFAGNKAKCIPEPTE